MKRLENFEKQLITKGSCLTFEQLAKMSTLNRQEFKEVAFGHNWHWRQKMLDIIKQHPDSYPHFHIQGSTRAQEREKGDTMIFDNHRRVNLSFQMAMEDPNIVSMISNAIVMYNSGFSIKNGVHVYLYAKSIYNLGTDKHQQFLHKSALYQDIGCFGLTELLHGSNVRGIQTEAHYDHTKRQFIINSPSKQAMKFWIGAAAEVANMSVIWAQLYIDGHCYGVHAFIVPIRDKATHKLLPGVLIGDCGPKNGCNIIDNGFMLFDNVRIPLDNLLNRISGVDQNGKFYSNAKDENERFGQHLSALSGGRFIIALNCSSMALSALTIAIRYCCLRRQFSSGPNEIENLLIEYPLTKRRMMPLLAQDVVYHFGNTKIVQRWDSNHKSILDPENTVIAELHAISSTLKPKSGWFATECIKECRQMLGGHGYSSFSKLGTLYNENDINNTWEGDNTVLLQQATKYVLDNARSAMKGKPIQSEILLFLNNPPAEDEIVISQSSLMDLQFGIKFLQHKIMSKVQDMGMKMLSLKQQKMPLFDIWNNSQVSLGQQIAFALGDLYYLENALKTLDRLKDENNRRVFNQLTQLWMLRVYRHDSYIDQVHHETIEKLMMRLCKEVARQSLGILDSLSCDDQVIGSPFACPQGRGFEKYMEMIKKDNPVNQRVPWWKMLKDVQN